MTDQWTFTVPGIPAPQGSKKVVSNGSGRAWLVNSNDKTLRPWRATVTRAAAQHVPHGWDTNGPFTLHAWFQFPRPKSHFGARGVLPSRAGLAHVQRPDLDKLVRAVCDALTDARVWRDDSHVVAMVAGKGWTEGTPGVTVHVTRPGVTAVVGA